MPLEIVTVPCLSDNYAYLAHDPETGATALVDVPEAAPILAALEDQGWTLDTVFITHHHADHSQDLPEILARHPAKVVGNKADAERLPPLDVAVAEGDSIAIGAQKGRVIDVSGHTIGHLAFYFPDAAVAFTADSLMALGCGRVFEGTHDQMHASLSKLAALDPDTLVCSGHEYTSANAAFALTVDPDNAELRARAAEVEAARAAGKPTVPSRLSVELATNPFLRASDPALQRAVGMEGADPVAVFTEIRNRKDRF
jgi:hydroxyacylglutathione hydrolase